MNDRFKSTILRATGAKELFEIEVIQNLWSGYGKIVRYGLRDSPLSSVVVKHVRFPKKNLHPRGWNTDLSHERKVKSYQVELAWYDKWNGFCTNVCRSPKCLALASEGNEVLMVLEDLNAAGFSARKTVVSIDEINICLMWLANFHAIFMNEQPKDLWKIGTYWHLDTRPDELSAMDDLALKKAAGVIDKKLRNCQFQTIVHGDAKLANFCFSSEGHAVAAVDFQYAGGGCGMKDVSYLIGSCLNDDECEKFESQLLDVYFMELKRALKLNQKALDFSAVENEWRKLYPIAWTDFHRFLKGWSPGHWKINSYSERLASKVLSQLSGIA